MSGMTPELKPTVIGLGHTAPRASDRVALASSVLRRPSRTTLPLLLERMEPYQLRAIESAWAILQDPSPRRDELDDLLRRLGIGKVKRRHNAAIVYRAMYEKYDSPKLQQHRPQAAGAGPSRIDPFRSDYERRTATALTVAHVPWQHESGKFSWRDALGRFHTYTPDFELPRHRDTYIEVKGPAGADSLDGYKMRRVLQQNPRLILTVWDAKVIETLEDTPTAEMVGRLIGTYRLTA